MSLNLKPLNYKYAVEIDKFWQKFWSEYTLPDDKLKVIDAVVTDDNDKAIAYGQAKLFIEFMLFIDMDQPIRDRVEALNLLMTEGFRGADQAGLKEVYCIIKDMRLARLIAKHFHFTLIENPGILLHRRLE